MTALCPPALRPPDREDLALLILLAGLALGLALGLARAIAH